MTDPAAEALARAAELPAWSSTAMPVTRKYLRGWADAVRALAEIVPMLELRETLENRCFTCGADEHHAHSPTCTMEKIREAIASFIRAMPGGSP